MKVCIFGAGALGGHLGARFSSSKAAEVTVVARGANLTAYRSKGFTLRSGGEEIVGKPVAATDDPSTLPPQKVVLTTLKANALAGVAETLDRLLAPDGTIVFVINGIPWWWNQGYREADGHMPLVDPQGELWKRFRTRALGCIAYSPNEVIAPGVVNHVAANRWLLGEPDNSKSARLQSVMDLFTAAGLKPEWHDDIRREIWKKIVFNSAGNSLSALTRLPSGGLMADPELKALGIALMNETLDVAAKMGWDVRNDIDPVQIMSRPERAGAPPSSMLQDVMLGRRLEADPMLGQIQALARKAGVATPTTDIVLTLLRGLDTAIGNAQAAR